jgi:PHD/YefM family antitoxin component YafN of YafNO toxin-antitoxin module
LHSRVQGERAEGGTGRHTQPCLWVKCEYGITLVYTAVHIQKQVTSMEALKVGIREFRDNLASYLLEAESPVAITRHGDTVGYYIPARRKRTDTERAALKEASEKWQEVLAAADVSEEEAVSGFKQRRRVGRTA